MAWEISRQYQIDHLLPELDSRSDTEALVTDGKTPNAVPGNTENGITNCRRDWRQGRLTYAAGNIVSRLQKVDVNFWSRIDS
jgi:hypothetical protein